MTASQPTHPKPSVFQAWRRPIMLVAVAGFCLGLYLSIRAQPNLFANLSWWPMMLVAFVGVPAAATLNAIEFRQSAAMIGQRFGFAQALEVTIIGGVANMLPLPGGTMVRVAALKSGGASLKEGTVVTLLVSGLWISFAFLYAGLWLSYLDAKVLGLGGAFLVIGLAAMAACVVISRRQSHRNDGLIAVMTIKVGQVLLDAARIWLCLLAIGAGASFGQASVLTVSSVVGAAVSVVPAGLGVREAVSALLGPFIMIAASAAFLSASLNRIVGLAIMAPVALILALRRSDPT